MSQASTSGSRTEPPASLTHASLVIERSYQARPGRVFSAWAKPEAKQRWFACHDEWPVSLYELDFRPGGRERVHTGPRGGTVHAFDARYHDIVADQRIVYSYEMRLDALLISVSLVSVEFVASREGTKMVFTEQGTFLDGHCDPEDRKRGTEIGLDKLGELLRTLPEWSAAD